ncbi:hypothetical protein VitviT2T_024959 [Vitis vinifera]|uniref:Uncharacterized protein n=1 Tax=Vitis vinifera TaxID=29760 RepID=A0ABY9DK81_VITVI|nr:hypothetical protein VitviT2T_024959 [Vitis vinifera]
MGRSVGILNPLLGAAAALNQPDLSLGFAGGLSQPVNRAPPVGFSTGDLLKEAGVSTSKVKSEVQKFRRKEGKKVESASGNTAFQTLKTYGCDLVE